MGKAAVLQPTPSSLSSDPPATAILTGGGNFKEGDSAAVEASPLPGWSFRNWTVDDRIVGTTPRLVYVMPDRDVNLVANLVRNYTLTVLAEPAGGGTVTGAGDYMAGSVLLLPLPPRKDMNLTTGRLTERLPVWKSASPMACPTVIAP